MNSSQVKYSLLLWQSFSDYLLRSLSSNQTESYQKYQRHADVRHVLQSEEIKYNEKINDKISKMRDV